MEPTPAPLESGTNGRSAKRLTKTRIEAAMPRRGPYYRWMFFAAGPLESVVTIRMLGFVTPADKARSVGYGSFGDVMDTLEKAVTDNPYIAGDRFTAADVYVGSHIGWGLNFGSLEHRPAFADYLGRVANRDAYRRANALDDEAMQDMQLKAHSH